MKLHFIAIGGSAMHNLAIALKKKGYDISGSDDEIFEPSRTKLEKHDILPGKIGWDTSKISKKLGGVILGMHAKKDNPELLKSQELGLKIYSYPEYIFNEAKDKQRVVIAGSHGKTTITAMTLHVLKKLNKDFDYLVGAQLEGFETMVRLSDAPFIIIEGDEYLSSPIDLKPKFLWYHPHIAVITGVAWDHINVFPTFDSYKKQFQLFIQSIEQNGSLIYYKNDAILSQFSKQNKNNIKEIEYDTLPYQINEGAVYLKHNGKQHQVHIFGKHNLQNLNAARLICNQLEINDEDFFKAIKDFKGASKRLELVAENKDIKIYKDFAHAPSKLKATIAAVREMHPKKKLIACIELHTFSSLNKKFLPQYKDSMDQADLGIIYYNKKTLEHKGLDSISKNEIIKAFNNKNLKVFTNKNDCFNMLENELGKDSILLMMSSGNFDGQDIDNWGKKLVME